MNQGELAIIYSWLALYYAAAGPGSWSLDGLRDGRLTPSAPIL